MRPADPAGFREARQILERLWDQTVARARRLPPELLHESVDGEWSFIETLRHLAFATDAWVSRAIGGDPSPWDPLGLPWDEGHDIPGVPRDRAARPSLDTVLELRRGRMSTVAATIDALTDESLAAHTTPVEGPGWPRPVSYPVRECLLIVLNEEWHHRLYAERDLAALEARAVLVLPDSPLCLVMRHPRGGACPKRKDHAAAMTMPPTVSMTRCRAVAGRKQRRASCGASNRELGDRLRA
jgi:uncharacterized damage-inducible protein DinB